MFVTALLIYLIATSGLGLNMAILAGAVSVDFFAWVSLQSSFEAWATGTTADQELWTEDE